MPPSPSTSVSRLATCGTSESDSKREMDPSPSEAELRRALYYCEEPITQVAFLIAPEIMWTPNDYTWLSEQEREAFFVSTLFGPVVEDPDA